MTKRKLVIISLFSISLALIIGGICCWYSEQSKHWAEQRLQEYIGRLEDSGFNVQEYSLADFQVDAKVKIHYFGDFRSYAEQEGVNPIYFDRGIHALYFLHSPTEDWVEANIFYY